MKLTRRWSVRFIHHSSVIETNLATRSHDPIMRIKSNCEQVFLCALSFWAWKKGAFFFFNSRRQKNFHAWIITIILFASGRKNVTTKSKSIIIDLVLTFIHTYCPTIPNKNRIWMSSSNRRKGKRKTVITEPIRQTSMRWQWPRSWYPFNNNNSNVYSVYELNTVIKPALLFFYRNY